MGPAVREPVRPGLVGHVRIGGLGIPIFPVHLVDVGRKLEVQRIFAIDVPKWWEVVIENEQVTHDRGFLCNIGIAFRTTGYYKNV